MRQCGFLLGCWLVAAIVLGGCSSAIKPTPIKGPPPPYDFTIVDPLAATVVGTPPGQAAKVPEQVNRSELTLRVRPGSEIPEVFWYANRLRYSLVFQPGPAPLIFLIAGTGAGHDSTKNTFLQRALFQGGYHVLSLPSPTFPEFIVAASSTGVPGRAESDARDLYTVMKLAYEQIKDRIQIEGFSLTGYSLGAWDAAFVAHLDDEEHAFDFDKVLLINPPVSLYNSAKILDAMLDDNIPGGPQKLDVFVSNVIKEVARVYEASSHVRFSSEYLLYKLYTELEPSDAQLKALIGLAFRFSSANLSFTSDVMTRSGMIVPANLRLGPASSLTDYFGVASRISFIDYFDYLYYPYFKARDPSITRQDLVDGSSLKSIENFLMNAKYIGMMTNEDDIILAPGEVEYLKKIFGDRAKIFPTGGHLGNLESRAVTAHVVGFFSN